MRIRSLHKNKVSGTYKRMTMERADKGHMNETLNLRSFYLRLLKKLWLIPLAGIICALLFLGVYTLVTVTFGPARSYQTTSQFYIKFAYDENARSQVDSYNAYTWNSLMSTDEILDVIMKELQGMGYDSLSGSDVVNDITAEIPSDVRVLLLTVKDNDRERAQAVTDAAVKSLISYGETNDAFDSIKLLNSEKAELVTYTDRSAVAAIFGLVVGLVGAVLVLMLLDAIDDAVYVPEDCETRYGLPVLGVLFKGSDKNNIADEIFRNDLIATCRKYSEGVSDMIFISVDSVQNERHSEEDMDSLLKALGSKCPEVIRDMTAISSPGRVLDNYRKIATSGGVILAVPYGKKCRSMAEHTIGQLRKHGCRIVGVLLTRADRNFMKKYYRIK